MNKTKNFHCNEIKIMANEFYKNVGKNNSILNEWFSELKHNRYIKEFMLIQKKKYNEN